MHVVSNLITLLCTVIINKKPSSKNMFFVGFEVCARGFVLH